MAELSQQQSKHIWWRRLGQALAGPAGLLLLGVLCNLIDQLAGLGSDVGGLFRDTLN
ncbi:MAG: hypothetical protein ACRDHL_01490 [Candidatus Promineifilaceae bacterium]